MNRLPLVCLLGIRLWVALICSAVAMAAPTLGPWQPLYKGVDHLTATNFRSSTDFNNLMVANALRIDLKDPDIRLLSTPRIDSYQANIRETAGRTVSRFLQVNHLQVAINANFFNPTEYYLAEGTAMAIHGLAISDGLLVSSRSDASPVLLVDTANQARIVSVNQPAVSTTDVRTAICGDNAILVNGVNVGRKFPDQAAPRTAVGLSEDKRYLYMLTIDGRQPGYSDGALHYETSAWLKLLGAYNGFNLDGGGSTTMVMETSTGLPKRLNRSSAVADSGRERTVGSHLGVYAKPLPGFIYDIVVYPDDTSAAVTWKTQALASTQVEYGLSSDLGTLTPSDSPPTTNHAVLLRNLKPDSEYYFRVLSATGTAQYASSNLVFSTTNYVTERLLVETTDSWKFTTANLDETAWTLPGFDDSSWNGPGNGLLWADVRSTGPNEAVQPKGEPLPVDPGRDGLPYLTYYFRRHFFFTGKVPGISLRASAYIDDGAVLYLNGAEIQRLRMEDAPTPIFNSSLATGVPCDGDATCPDEFAIAYVLADSLVEGDNVLAVEVHNYNPRSADITFGVSLLAEVPRAANPRIVITPVAGAVHIDWTRGGFGLQQADSPSGPWSDVPGPILAGPYITTEGGTARFYRLSR